MTFGKELSNEFHKLCNVPNLGEVSLFTKLMDSFINLSNRYPMYNITFMHSHNGQVIYKNSNTENKIKRATGVTTISGKTDDIIGVALPSPVVEFQCEISDLAFIVYSKHGVKVTYLQNKYERIFDISKKRFHVDVDQLGLLKGRPIFKVVSPKSSIAKHATCNILYDADIESVGSYGVFYKDNNNYEMFYCPADLINYSPIKSDTEITRKLNSKKNKYKKRNIPVKYEGEVSKTHRYNTVYEDCMYAETIEKFGDELINFHIGTILKEKELNKIKNFLKERGQVKILKKIESLGNQNQSDDDNDYVFTGAKIYIFIESNIE